MARKLALLFLCITLTTQLYVSVEAHSGDTDANGGHYDSDTGTYHYHHGYPAHKHYDIDGDGYRDCPYDFDDKTGINSGSSGGSGGSSNYTPSSYSQGYDDGYEDGSNDGFKRGKNVGYDNGYEEAKKIVPAWAYWVILILSILVAALAYIIKCKNRNLAEQRNRFEQKTALENNRIKSGIADLHFSLVKKYGTRYLYEISNAPEGDFVDDNLLPHSSYSLKDDYVYYLGTGLGSSRARYHHRNCRYAKHIYPINAYDARHCREYTPCSICPCKSLDTSWVDKYRMHYVFLSEYVQIAHREAEVLSPSEVTPKAEPQNILDNPDQKLN